jgi:SAM-dependent methyltransferase
MKNHPIINMPVLRDFKKLISPLSATPLHPQWLFSECENKIINNIKAIHGEKTVIDIGCANQWPKQHLGKECQYIGIDYPETADQWYKTKPNVYSDASGLPIPDNSADVVLLLDVLEHLKDPDVALKEIHRILCKQGILIIQVPYLYPLHDEPRDFQRYSKYGLERLAGKHGFFIKECHSSGHPVVTSALMANLAISKTFINWLEDKSPMLIFGLLLPFYFLVNNLCAKIIALLSKSDDFMPYSYQLVFEKY